MIGYGVEYWPGTVDVKQVTSVGDESEVQEGWSYLPAGHPLPDPVDPSPTAAETLSAVLAERDRLLALAAIRVDPLQDAVDLGGATPAEVELLNKWKQYRMDVNRVPDQEGFPVTVDWPEQPS